MSVVVNVMLSLMTVMSRPPALCMMVNVYTLGVSALGVRLFSWIGMTYACVLRIRILNSFSLFFYSLYVDLKYNIYLTLLLSLSMCSHVVVLGLSVRLARYSIVTMLLNIFRK